MSDLKTEKVCYGRIFLALLSIWFMPTNYVAAAWCYFLSGE